MFDAFGNRITTQSAATRDAIDVFAADWIGYGTRLRTILAAADADPGCAYVNALAAALHMALEAKEGHVAARPYLERMRRNAQGATDREQMTIAAVDAWSQGETRIALAIHRDMADRYRDDIVSAKWGQYHAFNLGDPVTMRAIAEAILPAHRDTPECWGMLAFAEEQCHRFGWAEDAAQKALARKPGDPWAQHALAHVYESIDRTGEAIGLLTRSAPGWSDRSIFIREHNWWHLALLHLDAGDASRALAIYDEQLWGTWPEFAQEQIGAVSALWRLELAGADVGARWTAVAENVAARGPEHLLPFHDLHFVYALARAGRESDLESLLRSLARHAAAATESAWPVVALPAAQALVAHARGEHGRAALLMLPVLGQLQRIGGSHAQRDVFLKAWIKSAMASGERSAVEDMLKARARHRAGIGSIRRFIARQARPRLRHAA
jgi:tetratricopeptide (TPR) repeat protein